jgi:hypothetical protein
MTNIAKKSILARLLARENIAVEQTNHHTAFFDVERRILGLPYWKDVGNDLYDLLVGHEIGHALHTPAAGWHESTSEIPGCPRSYINIVEDIRIEKLVLREFPGLYGSFMRGYQDLLDRDFFGIKNENVNKLSFMNRLNIFSKSRGLVKVKFSKKEQPYVDRAMAVETWDDVIASCRELYAFMKDELDAAIKAQQELEEAMKKAGIKPPMGIPSKIIVSRGNGNSGEKSEPMSEELKEAILNGEVEIEVDVDSFKEEQEQEEKNEEDIDIPVTVDAEDNIEGVETDALFRSAIARSLVDSLNAGGSTLYAKGPSKALANAITSQYEAVKKGRYKKVDSVDFPTKQYIRFISDIKDSVAVMVKEFEMRKTARRFARARTSTKGSLDVNVLHKYKYEDNLFKQVTHLDDDQSHGMVMLIDYSGSMSSILPKVIKQVLILSAFCKRVNIPFEVYGFTNPYGVGSDYQRRVLAAKADLTAVSMSNTHVFKLIDSSMAKKVYEEAFKSLFAQTCSNRRQWMGALETMGGTPLDTAILAMYHHIADFKAKHNVQKMNFITLTDGQGDGIGIENGIDLGSKNTRSGFRNRVIDIMGQKITVDYGYGAATPSILNGLRNMGVRTMNYHLVSTSDIKYQLGARDPQKLADALAQVNKDGCLVLDRSNGYDRQIFTVLGGTSLSKDEDSEDDLSEDTREIASTFTNKAFKRKQGRLIAAKFAEIVS